MKHCKFIRLWSGGFMCDRMFLWAGGNPNQAGVRGMDQQDQVMWGENIHFRWPRPWQNYPPPSDGVMFAGSMCCKVRVILALGATPAPVLRVNPILPIAWWAAERHKPVQKEWKRWHRWVWKPDPSLTLNTHSATSCSPSQTSTPSIAVCLPLSLALKLLLFIFLGLLD